ncbi:MAG: haloacid dehalogenase-like hydrolase [Proteobacteria bacterium]|nr:haloacid dehalogenase-like hydrolase [Pseudomonadota bacterium]
MLTSSPLPLVLDLDGTLIRTDTFHEMMVCLLITKPWRLFLLPFWLLKGRPYAKARLAQQTDLSPTHLPYNISLLTFIKTEVQKGRPLILATGTNQKVAQRIATHLGFFQEVIGSDDNTNMTGLFKRQALLKKLEPLGFDYAGDSKVDSYIWQVAHKAIVVHPKAGVLKRALTLRGAELTHVFPREKARFWALLQTFRPQFWLLNLLVPSWPLFFALSFLSSGLFIGDDLVMLSHERKGLAHQSMFAKGHLHLITAFALAPLLILPSVAFLTFSSGVFLTLAYVLLFIGVDRATRSQSRETRGLLLGLLQLLAAWTFSK